MPYKDKQKTLEAVTRYRERQKGITQTRDNKVGITVTGGTKPIYVNTEQAAKLLMICNALDKDIHGLDGRVNLLSMVRYGVYGPTLEQVKVQLDVVV